MERVLRGNPRGLSVRGIVAALPGAIPAHKASEVLRGLQRRGLVKLKGGVRWQWVGQGRPGSAPPAQGVQQQGQGGQPPLRSAGLPDPRRRVPTDSRWADFRRLCLYYAECVRLEDRAKVSDYAERENQRFLTITQRLDWHAISGGAPVVLPVPPEWGRFIRHIRSQRRSVPRLFLGAPVDFLVLSDRDSDDPVRIISPIFVQQVEFSVEGDCLYLNPVSPVEVNHGWLERRFRKPEDRGAFMEVCGLEQPEPDDEEGSLSKAMPGFHELCTSLFNGYREWWKEFADLGHLDHAPGFLELDERGVYNRAVLIAQPTLKYAGRLYQELLWLAQSASDEDLDKSALRLLFPHGAPAETGPGEQPDQPAKEDSATALCDVGEYEALNRRQREACRLAMSAPLSVVTGPPGTGKSRVVAQAMANAALRRMPVLFASRNHQALEAVVPRLNALVAPEVLAIRLARPFGEPFPESITQTIVNMLAVPRPEGILDRLRGDLVDLERLLSRRLEAEELWKRVFSVYQDLDDAQRALEESLEAIPDSLAAKVSEGLGVPTERAVETAAQTLAQLLERPRSWPRRLVWHLKRFLRGRAAVARADAVDRAYRKELGLSTGTAPALKDPRSCVSLLESLRRWHSVAQAIASKRRLSELRREMELHPNLEEVHGQFARFHKQIPRATERCLGALSQSFGASLSGDVRRRFAEIAAELQNYGDDAERHSRQLRKALKECLPLLLNEIPLWATSNLTAGRNIPRAAGTFDLLIIDEATQCDIASVVPLLYRARRVMAVGDPMQLQHVSTLRRGVDARLRAKFELTDIRFARFTHRVNSFFNLAFTDEDLSARIQLQDHHRCHSAIVGYCNATFYRETLRVMTDPHRLVCPAWEGRSVSGFKWTSVPADAEAAPGGGAISRGQIEAVVRELADLRDCRFPGTVGVVTPFRAQAKRIRDRVAVELGPDLPAYWRFIADTADGFQGDERDVILLSLPGGPGMPRGSRWFLAEGRNRFNVAVSRAKALLHVFADEDWCKGCGIAHIQALCQAWSNQPEDGAGACRLDLVGPKWEPALADALRHAEIPFRQQYPACGRYLDFALIRDGLMLDVEVDGEAYHRDSDGLRKVDDLQRDLVLIANGWKVLRFWVYELREDMSGCVDKIRAVYEGSSEQVGLEANHGQQRDC